MRTPLKFTLTTLTALLLASSAMAQEVRTRTPRLVLSPTSLSAAQSFGSAVAADSGTAAFGAPGALAGAGSVSVFERGSSNSWSLIATVVASDAAAGDGFGAGVALDGSILAVGAPAGPGSFVDQGAVYIFRKVGAAWTQVAKVVASDGANSDGFGTSVAIKGDTLVVGAPGADVGGAADRGAAYVFRNTSGNSWTQTAELTNSSGIAGDRFGTAVATRSSRALVGAPGGAGSAHLFRNSGGSWISAVDFTSGEASAAGFGSAVALAGTLAGDWATIGAPQAVTNGIAAGAAFIYQRTTDTAWPLAARIVAGDPATGDAFGAALAAHDDRVIVGAPSDTVNAIAGAGSATTFRRIATGSWQLGSKLAAATGSAGGHFADAVAIAGERVMVGAPDTSNGASGRGAGYHFKLDYARSSVDDNGRGDVVWFNPLAGRVSTWTMNGLARESSAGVTQSIGTNFEFDGCGDFYGDGRTSVLFRKKSDGSFRLWRLNGAVLADDQTISGPVAWDWRYLATADLSGDGRADILFRRASTGQVNGWMMSGSTKLASGTIGSALGLEFLGAYDVDGDSRADLLWRDGGGVVRVWAMNGLSVVSNAAIAGAPAMAPAWALVGAGDLDADGDQDLVWRNITTGAVQGWTMANAAVQVTGTIAAAIGLQWRVESMCDLDGDGDDDLVWRNKSTGDVNGWLMNGLTRSSSSFVRNAPLGWSVLSDDDYNDDHGHDGHGDDDNSDDSNGDDWNDDRGGSDDDDDNSSGGSGSETVSVESFSAALSAAFAANGLPLIEAEAEFEGSATYVEVLQWNQGTGQFVRTLVHASTLAIASNFTWTPSASQYDDHADEIAVLTSVTVSASSAIAQVLATRAGSLPHSVELEAEDSGPRWSVEIVSPTGVISEIQVSAD